MFGAKWNRLNLFFWIRKKVEQSMRHLVITSESSNIYNTTDFEQYLFKRTTLKLTKGTSIQGWRFILSNWGDEAGPLFYSRESNMTNVQHASGQINLRPKKSLYRKLRNFCPQNHVKTPKKVQ